MMSAIDPPLHETVYQGIKKDYLEGRFVPGKRIDIQDLADRHRSSKTPVREAAFIMVGEGLLAHHADGGFLVPIIEPAELIELLAWHMQLMSVTLSSLRESLLRTVLQRFSSISVPLSGVSVATLATDIFVSLVEATGNRQAVGQVRRLNERIHYSRIMEATEPFVASRELVILTSTDVMHVSKAARRRIEAYHMRKIVHLQKVIEVGIVSE